SRVSPILLLRVGCQEIRTTAEHPFYARERGWVPAGMLEPGDWLLTRGGQWVVVESAAANGEVTTVYNFEVAGYHTYFVGDETWGFDLWTHNHELGPNGGQRNPADQARIDEQRGRRAERRERERRDENGQKPRGNSTDHDS